jgi:hypothetical protein
VSNSIVFLVSCLFGFVFIARRIGWSISGTFLYSGPIAVTAISCVLWGALIAVAIFTHQSISKTTFLLYLTGGGAIIAA